MGLGSFEGFAFAVFQASFALGALLVVLFASGLGWFGTARSAC